MAEKAPKTSGAGSCPICGEATEHAFRPFCSRRCRDVDLAKWLGDGYAIAGGQAAADEDGDDQAAGRGGRRDEDGES
jgi:endogenous inhibitor of DNA gyrase (YacG/DUF329 family)